MIERVLITEENKALMHPMFMTQVFIGPLGLFVRRIKIIMVILLMVAARETIHVGSLQYSMFCPMTSTPVPLNPPTAKIK